MLGVFLSCPASWLTGPVGCFVLGYLVVCCWGGGVEECVCVCVHMCACVHVCMHVCVCEIMCECVYMCVMYMCV